MKTSTYPKIILRACVVYVLGVLFIWLVASCEKHVTPNKVERKIQKDSWAIGTFNFMDTTIENQFLDKSFGFGEDGSIRVVEDSDAAGSWLVSESKKPTLLFISSFIDTPYVFLNDDWTVTRISSDAMSLESDNGAYLNQIKMTRIKE